ncbi:MAG: lysoplasmalogenase [Flavobacteriaceae bacterium]|nr:lysoplasmalogenase [Flavobacteriaceae bacterium]
MQYKQLIPISIVYFLMVINTIILSYNLPLTTMYYISKPAILGILIFVFAKLSYDLDAKTRLFTVLALVCSLTGDILLMYSSTSELYFIGGLIAFLLAHIMYIIVFLKQRDKHTSVQPITLILLLYGAGIFYMLKAGLNTLMIPIIVYMLVILSMAVTAFMRKGKVSKTSFTMVFLGAILFLISDSILALNKFYEPMYSSGITVILTYGIAQYLIVLGLLKQNA